MSVISRMRKQNAIYWPPGQPDSFGRPAHGVLVELTLSGGVNSRVRWEDVNEEFKDREGTVKMSMAKVYVPLLPDGSEVKTGGFLWLGDRADLTSEADPRSNSKAYEIVRVDKLPTFKANEFLRTCYL